MLVHILPLASSMYTNVSMLFTAIGDNAFLSDEMIYARRSWFMKHDEWRDNLNVDLHQLGHHVRSVTFDDSCSQSRSLIATELLERDEIAMYIGPTCSSSCMLVASVGKVFMYPNIGPTCTSGALSDTTQYPYFARCAPSADEGSRLAILLSVSLNWTSVSLMYENTAFGEDLSQGVLDAAQAADVTVESRASFSNIADTPENLAASLETVASACLTIDGGNSRIVFVQSNGEYFSSEIALRLAPPQYLIVASVFDKCSFYLLGCIRVTTEPGDTTEFLDTYFDTTNFTEYYAAHWQDPHRSTRVVSPPEEMPSLDEIKSLLRSVVQWLAQFTDGQVQYGRALKQMIVDGADFLDPKVAIDYFIATPMLDGISGAYTTATNGDRDGVFAVRNLQVESAEEVTIGTISAKFGLSFYDGAALTYPTGSTDTFPDIKEPLKPNPIRVLSQGNQFVEVEWDVATVGALRGGDLVRTTLYIKGVSSAPAASIEIQSSSTETIYRLTSSDGLEKGKQYSICVTLTNRGGESSCSDLVVTGFDPFIPCQETGCGLDAECLPDSDTCTCIAGLEYLQEADDFEVSRSCEPLFTPCSDYECRGFGTCSEMSGICQCDAGTVLAEMALKTEQQRTEVAVYMEQEYKSSGELSAGWKTCVLDVASSEEAREFWTLSLWLSAWGLLGALLLSWEFLFNDALKHPNTMMQAFVAFAVPDLVLSFMNFVVYIQQLVLGYSLGDPTGKGGYNESGCLAVAFLMYVIVMCNFMAPAMVSFFTFLKFNSVAQGKASFALPTAVVLCVCIGFPLILGLSLAAGTYATKADDGESVLGSYRGLYCFIRRWEPKITLAIIVVFALSAATTMLFLHAGHGQSGWNCQE